MTSIKENLASFTEINLFADAYGSVDLSTTSCQFTTIQRKDDNHYVYKDYGNSFFGDCFEHKFWAKLTAASANDTCIVIYGMSNNLGDASDHSTTWAGQYIQVWFYRQAVNVYQIYLYDGITNSTYNTTSSLIGKDYYFKLIKNYRDVTCIIYSDAAMTTIVTTLNLTLNNDYKFKYLYVMSSNYFNSSPAASGWSGDYELLYGLKIESDNYEVWLRYPENFSINDEKNITSVHYYTYGDLTFDEGKNIENITINGVFQSSTTGTYTNMCIIDSIMEAGEKITITGFNNSKLDTTWYIEDFSYNVEGGMPNTANWSLSLEKEYDI